MAEPSSNGFVEHIGNTLHDGPSLADGQSGSGWILDFKYDEESHRLIKTWVKSEGDCFYCGTPLDPRYDYRCVICNRPACDNCNQACQEEDGDCDTITCSSCVELHIQESHPEAG